MSSHNYPRIAQKRANSYFHCGPKSYANWNIFFNFGSNVHLNKGMCRTHVTLLPAEGQGQIEGKKIEIILLELDLENKT